MQQKYDVKYAPLPNNETYAYREAGYSHNILILLHGNLSSSYYYETIFPSFSHEYRVIAPDLRGYGHSTSYTPPDSIDDLVQDLKLFVEHLNIEKFALLGWSLGGGLAMKFAANYPSHVTKLILFHSVGIKGLPKYLEDEHEEPTNIRAKTFEDLMPLKAVADLDLALKEKDRAVVEARCMKTFFCGRYKPSREELDAYVNETMLQKSFFIASNMLNIYNISNEDNGVNQGTGEIDKIECQTLVICGRKDPAVPVEEGEKIVKLLGEKAQIKIFEDCGHFAIGDYFEEFVDLLHKFLKE